MTSPDATLGNFPNLNSTSASSFDDHGWNPSWIFGLFGTKVECVARITYFEGVAKHGALSVMMVCGNPKCEKSCSSESMVLFAEMDWVGWVQGYLV